MAPYFLLYCVLYASSLVLVLGFTQFVLFERIEIYKIEMNPNKSVQLLI